MSQCKGFSSTGIMPVQLLCTTIIRQTQLENTIVAQPCPAFIQTVRLLYTGDV